MFVNELHYGEKIDQLHILCDVQPNRSECYFQCQSAWAYYFSIEVGHTLVYSMHQSFVTTVLLPSTYGDGMAFHLRGWGGLPPMRMGWPSTYGDGVAFHLWGWVAFHLRGWVGLSPTGMWWVIAGIMSRAMTLSASPQFMVHSYLVLLCKYTGDQPAV